MKTAIACVIYLGILIYVSYRSYKNTTSAQDYLLGGRRTHQLVMALSYGATFISTSAVIGFGGLAATNGLSLLWLAILNVLVGVFIAFVFFGKRTHKLGLELDAHTFPELLGKRFNSKTIQFTAGLLIFLFMPIYAAAVIKGGVNFMEAYFKIPYDASLLIFVTIVAVYVLMGGIKAVVYTDFVQGLVLFLSMIVLVGFTYIKLGGIIQGHTALTNLYYEPNVQSDIASLKSIGFLGWTSMPAFNTPLWWGFISSVLGAVGFGVLAQPQLVVRFMTVKSRRDLNRAVLPGAVFIIVMAAGAYVVGALSNVLIYNDTGLIAKVAAGSNDNVIPYFITKFMPEWYSVLFLIAMLAASMSTLSAQFHTMGSALGRDVGGVLIPSKKDSISINRYGMCVAILLSLAIAWGAKYMDGSVAVIAKGTIIFFEMSVCAFLPVYVGALFFKKMPKKAAEAGMFSGIIVWFLWTFFISAHAKSLMLCKVITGKDYLLEGHFDRIASLGSSFVGIPVAAAVIAVVWFICSKTEAK